MPNEQLEQAKLEVIAYAQRMLHEGLVKGTSGNVSVRVGDEVAITPGSVPYEDITPDGVAIVDLDGNHISGGNPSSETPLHTLVYRETDAPRSSTRTPSMRRRSPAWSTSCPRSTT